jgi:hypothetical protein
VLMGKSPKKYGVTKRHLHLRYKFRQSTLRGLGEMLLGFFLACCDYGIQYRIDTSGIGLIAEREA